SSRKIPCRLHPRSMSYGMLRGTPRDSDTDMAKPKTIFTCTECGGQATKWQGQCAHCNAWNTLVETAVESIGKAGMHRFSSLAGVAAVVALAEVEARDF